MWHPEKRLHRRLHTGIDHLILTTPCAPVWTDLDWLSYVSIDSLFTRGRYCLLSFWLSVRQNKHWDISTDVEAEAFWQTNFTFPKHVSFSFFICIRPFTAHFFKEENFGWKRKHKALLVFQVQLWGHGLGVTGATCIVMFCFNDWRNPAVLILLHFLCLVMLCCTIFCFVELSCTIMCFVVLSCTIFCFVELSCTIMCFVVLSCTIVCFVVLCCAIVCFVARFFSYYTIHCFFSWVGIHENGTNNRSWRFLQLNTRYPKYWQDTNVLKIDFNFDKVQKFLLFASRIMTETCLVINVSD